MASPIFRTGFDGLATFNGTDLGTVSWSGSFTSDIQVFKNSLSGNHPQRAATFSDATGTIVVDWADTTQPFANPPTIVSGSLLTNLYLYVSKASNLYWAISNAIVVGTPMSGVRDGKISLSINWAVNGGTITPPAGTAY